MQLRSGPSLWSQMDPPAPGYAPLDGDLSCDVAVIGAGITGALVADHLAEAGLEVAVLDRRGVCQGSTAASTGLLQYEIDTHLTQLGAAMGMARACRAYRASYDALLEFESLVGSLGDSCGLRRKRSLYLASQPRDAAELQEEQAARRACGIDVEYLPGEAVRERFGLERPAALFSPFALEVDPYRLCAALMGRAHRRGAAVFGRTEAGGYEIGADGISLRTDGGHAVRAGHVVFATGYETPEFIRLPVRLKSTYAVVSRRLAEVPATLQDQLIWESARPYLYVRTAPGDRVIVGGEDIDAADPAIRDAMLGEKSAALTRKFRGLFPSSPIEAEIAWAGTFAETADGLPLIGPAAEFPRAYFALGYGGNGITFSLLAAQIIRDALLGRAHRAADLFPLRRSG